MKTFFTAALCVMMVLTCACSANIDDSTPAETLQPSAAPSAPAVQTPSLPTPSPSPTQQIYTVSTVTSLDDQFVYVYKQPSSEADIVGAAVMGVKFTVTDYLGDWCEVIYSDQTGYISASHLMMVTGFEPAPEHEVHVYVPPKEELGLVQTRFNNELSIIASAHNGVQTLDIKTSGGKLLAKDASLIITSGIITADPIMAETPEPSPTPETSPTPEPVHIVIQNGKITTLSGIQMNNADGMEIHLSTSNGTDLVFDDSIFQNADIQVTDGHIHSTAGSIYIESRYYLVERMLKDNLVDVALNSDGIEIDMMFAKDENLLGDNVYGDEICLLQIGTLEKLKKAQQMFAEDGYTIVIYDAYRPYSVTEQLWEKYHDGRYVAPTRFGSVHNKGAAIDMSLLDASGNPIEMPSPIHTFDETANRSSKSMTETAQANMDYMTEIMKACGFATIDSEWWHFTDTDKMDYLRTDHDLSSLLRVIYE